MNAPNATIFAAGAAPRVTQADIDAAVTGETYTLLPNGRTTVCQLTLANGFTVEGLYAAVFAENFDADKGRVAARNDAVSKCWLLLGFQLRDKHFGSGASGGTVTAPPAEVAPIANFRNGVFQTKTSIEEFGADTWFVANLQLSGNFPEKLSDVERARVVRNTYCNWDGTLAGSSAPPLQFQQGGTPQLDALLARCNSSPFTFDAALDRGNWIQNRKAPLRAVLGVPAVVAIRAVSWAAFDEYCRWAGAERRRIGHG